MNITRLALLSIAMLTTATMAIWIYFKEVDRRIVKEDLIELSMAKYGVFNVDEWKSILAEVISKKVEDLKVDGSNRSELRASIQEQLHAAVDGFEEEFDRENSRNSFFGVSLPGLVAKSTSLFSRIRGYIPTLTEQILDYLEKPENRDRIKRLLIDKIDEYAAETFADMDYAERHQIIDKHGFDDLSTTIVNLKDLIAKDKKEHQLIYYLFFTLILVQLIMLISWRSLSRYDYAVLICASFILLGLGLSLPMIDIDARISIVSFQLLGEPVSFSDQVLYFKSKSILEVVHLMFAQGKYDIMIVGFLVLLFSVLFPAFKLVSSLIFVFQKGMRDQGWIRFFVFKTGKWSMADVMVIVIFMAYIGFSSILSEQLGQIEQLSKHVDLFTTNESSLQLGFYMFTAFVIFSLFISERLSKLAKA